MLHLGQKRDSKSRFQIQQALKFRTEMEIESNCAKFEKEIRKNDEIESKSVSTKF